MTRPGWTWRRALSYGIAVSVHASSLVLVAGGVALVVRGFPSIVVTGAGLVLVAIGVGLRPRLGRMPSDVVPLTRVEAPQTWRLVDDVSAAAGVPAPSVLVVGTEVNASVASVGVRRRRVVQLGLGLHGLLRPQELASVLGHEVAHVRNGDLRQGLLVGTAMDTLVVWWQALHGDRGREHVDGFAIIAELLAAAAMAVLRLLPLGVLSLLLRLQLGVSQRAEYLADQIGADVAGTEAMSSGLEALLLADSAWDAMQRAALRDDPDVWAAPRTYRDGLPASELERRERAARNADVAIDSTHPPTMLRADLVRSRPPRPAAVLVDRPWSEAIDRELAPARRALERRLRGELLDAG